MMSFSYFCVFVMSIHSVHKHKHVCMYVCGHEGKIILCIIYAKLIDNYRSKLISSHVKLYLYILNRKIIYITFMFLYAIEAFTSNAFFSCMPNTKAFSSISCCCMSTASVHSFSSRSFYYFSSYVFDRNALFSCLHSATPFCTLYSRCFSCSSVNLDKFFIVFTFSSKSSSTYSFYCSIYAICRMTSAYYA